MTKYMLEIECNDEYGYDGAIIKYPNPRPYHFPLVTGNGIAHDILQHPFTPHPDPFIDELMALGALAIHLPHVNLKAHQAIPHELTRLFEENPSSLLPTSNYSIPPVRGAAKETELFGSIRDSVDPALRLYEEDSDREFDEEPFVPDRELILAWMHKGSQLFKRRFYPNIYDTCSYLHDKITREVDGWLRHEPPVGSTADLFITFRRFDVRLEGAFSPY